MLEYRNNPDNPDNPNIPYEQGDPRQSDRDPDPQRDTGDTDNGSPDDTQTPYGSPD